MKSSANINNCQINNFVVPPHFRPIRHFIAPLILLSLVLNFQFAFWVSALCFLYKFFNHQQNVAWFKSTIKHFPKLQKIMNSTNNHEPDVDVMVTDQEVIVHVDLPGVMKNKIEVRLEKDELHINAFRKTTSYFDTRKKNKRTFCDLTGASSRTVPSSSSSSIEADDDDDDVQLLDENEKIVYQVNYPQTTKSKSVPVKFLTKETKEGKFSKHLKFPNIGLTKTTPVSATYHDGVLELIIPKYTSQPRKVIIH